MNSLTVEQVQAAATALADTITAAVQEFEASTACIIHSLPVIPASKSLPATVQVKVQIP